MAEPGDQEAIGAASGYERSDWPIAPIGLALLGVLLFLIVAPLVLMRAYPGALSDVRRGPSVEPPAPRLQISPPQDLADFQAEEQQRLDGYYWIDKQRGIVHIPIDRAMKKIAEQGIAGFPKGPQ